MVDLRSSNFCFMVNLDRKMVENVAGNRGKVEAKYPNAGLSETGHR